MYKLVNADCTDWLRQTKDKYDTIFMDPPDNIGLSYNSHKDQLSNDEYYNWLELLLHLSIDKAKVVWLSYYHKHDLEIKYRLRSIIKQRFPIWEVRTYIWNFNFGQYRESDSPNNYRPIIRISSPIWQPVMEERVPSVREEMGDLRATGLGRVPGDVWEYCRIQGNNNERREWHPTQMPQAIYKRISIMSGGKTFVDLFAGTGTCFRAIKDKDVIGIEKDAYYCQKISEEHKINIEFN